MALSRHTELPWRGALSAPYASFTAALVNSARPVMGRYSLSGFEVSMICSAFFTLLRT